MWQIKTDGAEGMATSIEYDEWRTLLYDSNYIQISSFDLCLWLQMLQILSFVGIE